MTDKGRPDPAEYSVLSRITEEDLEKSGRPPPGLKQREEGSDLDVVRRALGAWERTAPSHGIDFAGVGGNSRSGPLYEQGHAPSRDPALIEQESDPLGTTLDDIESGGKMLARAIHESGHAGMADRFAELMQEAIRIADATLFDG